MQNLNSVERGIPVNRALSKSSGLPFTWLHHQRIGDHHFVHEVRVIPMDNVYDSRLLYSCFKKSANGNILVMAIESKFTLSSPLNEVYDFLRINEELLDEASIIPLKSRVTSVIDGVTRRYLFERTDGANHG